MATKILKVRIDFEGDMLERVLFLKSKTGIKSTTELLRTLVSVEYHKEKKLEQLLGEDCHKGKFLSEFEERLQKMNPKLYKELVALMKRDPHSIDYDPGES